MTRPRLSDSRKAPMFDILRYWMDEDSLGSDDKKKEGECDEN